MPDWLIEQSIGHHAPPVYVHVGGCHMAGKRSKSVTITDRRPGRVGWWSRRWIAWAGGGLLLSCGCRLGFRPAAYPVHGTHHVHPGLALARIRLHYQLPRCGDGAVPRRCRAPSRPRAG
ncbi:DUF6233 domain-containing protein [Streptomyces sp. NPDC003015]